MVDSAFNKQPAGGCLQVYKPLLHPETTRPMVSSLTPINRSHQRLKRRAQCIMASDSEWAMVKALADRAGLGISDYVRRQLLDEPELAPDPKPETPSLPFNDELFREVVECVLIHHGLLKEHYDRDPELKARMVRITRRVQRNLEMKTGSR